MLFVFADIADGRNAARAPEMCQLSEFDNLGGTANERKLQSFQ